MPPPAPIPPQVACGETLIEIRRVTKIFRLRGEEVAALRDIDVDILRGEYLSIMGPSGSGKSTLFNIIGALDRPTSGTVKIGPLELSRLTSRQLAYVRCHYIGYIFQSYNLIPSLTALANVALPRILLGADTATAYEAAAAKLEQVGLGHRLDHRPDALSGGQQQRVAIARALVNDPTILLADEPTGNLDLQTGEEIIGLLKDLSVQQGVTVISATHDYKMLSTSHRVLWMREGRVERLERRENLDIRVGALEAAAPRSARSQGAAAQK